METDPLKGYADQELLVRALVKFVSTQIGRSEQITLGLYRQCLSDYTDQHGTTFMQIKHWDEDRRLKMVDDLIDLFFEKIKHLIASPSKRDKLKASIVQIYQQWKVTHRTDAAGQ